MLQDNQHGSRCFSEEQFFTGSEVFDGLTVEQGDLATFDPDELLLTDLNRGIAAIWSICPMNSPLSRTATADSPLSQTVPVRQELQRTRSAQSATRNV